MASKSVETKRFGEKRQAIINAASTLINEVGVQATTLSEVASAIGLNATSITYYFKRKDQLVVAVYEDTLTRMESIAREALAKPDTAARLRHFLKLHIALRTRIRSGESGLLTALSEIRSLDQETQQPLLLHYRQIIETVQSFFGGSEDRDVRALNLARAHILLEAIMWWPIWSRRYSVLDFSRVEDRLFDILAHGLSADCGHWTPERLEGDWRTSEPDAASQNDAFLRAATVMINQRGYRGASVNRIAKALNVTKGSFYHHHEAKDELVLACFQKSYDRLSAVQLAALDVDADYWTRLSSALHELVDLQFNDPMPLLRTTALQALESTQKADVVTRSNRLARRFAGILIDGIADGSLRAVDPLIASQVIMSTINSAYEARRWTERFDDREKAIRTYLSVLSRGMLSDPSGC